MDQPPFQSSFTSELSNDAKLLANIEPNDPLAAAFYGMPELSDTDGIDFAQQFAAMPDDVSISKQLASYGGTDYFHNLQPQSKFLNIPGQESRIGTPGGGEGDSWDNWIDQEQWNSDAEQQCWVNEHC
jgi:hypothetical protein